MVTLSTLTPRNIAETVEAVGVVKSAHPTTLAAKMTSAVVAVHVQASDHVRAGQVLVTLDDRELQTQVRKAKAARRDIDYALAEIDHAILAADKAIDTATVQQELAKTTFTRYATLFARGSVAPQEYDGIAAQQKTATAALAQTAASKAALSAKRQQILAKITQAEADLTQAQVILSYSSITAPRAGMITARMAEIGMMAIPGAPLLTLDSETYVLEATLPESDSTKVRVGQEGTVTLDALRQTASGTIREMIPAQTPLSRTFTIKIALLSVPGLRTGMYGKSQFAVGQRTGLLIPATALVERGQLQSVFTVNEHNRVNMRLVTTGKTVHEGIELLGGVESGERVVVRGAEMLTDGMFVTEEKTQ